MLLRKVTSRTASGNRVPPLSRRQSFAVAMASLNAMRHTVPCDSAPLVRTTQCLAMANRLSVWSDVRRWSQCSTGTSKVSRTSRSLSVHEHPMKVLTAVPIALIGA